MCLTKCLCGRMIPSEEHTGRCQLDHFRAYMCIGDKNFADLNDIIATIIEEAAAENSGVAKNVAPNS